MTLGYNLAYKERKGEDQERRHVVHHERAKHLEEDGFPIMADKSSETRTD